MRVRGPVFPTLLSATAFFALVGCAGLDSSPLQITETGEALLEGRSVAEWSVAMEPEGEVTAWKSIPWHSTFHEGALAAAEEGKPLLLWLMNGHPLGCT